MRVRKKIKIKITQYDLRCKVYVASRDAVEVRDVCIVVCRGVNIDEAVKTYNNESGNVIVDITETLSITDDVAVVDVQEILNKLV